MNQTKSDHPHRFLHVVLRVKDLDASLAFYTGVLGMHVLRREDFPEGRFTLAFVGYEPEDAGAVIELTYNWDACDYEKGSAFGHVALAVRDIEEIYESLVSNGTAALRPPGPMMFSSTERTTPEDIAFITDPDGCAIELIERR